MSIKYISKDKNGRWKLAISKSGKAVRVFTTQKEAIAYAGATKNTEAILIKRSSGWDTLTGWDKITANIAIEKVATKQARGMAIEEAKIKTVQEIAGGKTQQIKTSVSAKDSKSKLTKKTASAKKTATTKKVSVKGLSSTKKAVSSKKNKPDQIVKIVPVEVSHVDDLPPLDTTFPLKEKLPRIDEPISDNNETNDVIPNLKNTNLEQDISQDQNLTDLKNDNKLNSDQKSKMLTILAVSFLVLVLVLIFLIAWFII